MAQGAAAAVARWGVGGRRRRKNRHNALRGGKTGGLPERRQKLCEARTIVQRSGEGAREAAQERWKRRKMNEVRRQVRGLGQEDTPGMGPRRKNERPRQYWTMVVARRMRASITCKHVFSSCGGDEKMMAVMLRPTGATGPRSTAHALGGSRQLFFLPLSSTSLGRRAAAAVEVGAGNSRGRIIVTCGGGQPRRWWGRGDLWRSKARQPARTTFSRGKRTR